jgi:hypothetical protein
MVGQRVGELDQGGCFARVGRLELEMQVAVQAQLVAHCPLVVF